MKIQNAAAQYVLPRSTDGTRPRRVTDYLKQFAATAQKCLAAAWQSNVK